MKAGLTLDGRFDILLGGHDAEAKMGRWVAPLRLIGVGFFIGGSIMLGVFLGLWLDNKLNTGPILVIVGLILGIAVAFCGVYQMLLPLMGN
ncbi:MAG: AtpZ/AtpI family protein, partial [Deltaproteobacteria bacterium]|nr:AtpZ/AtpI family protein [Deltaproteobacteria bacterium]